MDGADDPDTRAPVPDGGTDDCPFCDIVAGEAPAYRVHEGELSVAFLDINPVADGHTLVVPREHRPTLTDATPEEAGAVFRTVRAVASAVEDALHPDGVNAFHASGSAAGQDVFHAHVHVIPREFGDDIRFAPPRHSLRPEDGERIAELLGERI